MAQLRQDYQEFTRRGAEIITIGPDGPKAFKRFWETESIPYIGLADIGNKIADIYGQQVNWLKFGRMPAIVVVDQAGGVRYRHFGRSMSDIPENSEILKILDEIGAST